MSRGALSRSVAIAPIPLALVRAEDCDILEASSSFAALMGCTREQLHDTSLTRYVTPAKEVGERLRAVEESGRVEAGFPVRAGPAEEGVLMACWPVGEAGRGGRLMVLALGGGVGETPHEGGLATTVQQVNEALMLRALKERERAEDARQESRAKSVFLASVSHELRTPLNSIVGHAQLLEEGIPVALPEELEDHVEKILAAADHLRELIEQIIAASRAEIETAEEVDTVHLGLLAAEVRDMVETQADERGLELKVRVNDCPEVRSNEKHLRQILLNLLNNAVKFTEEGWVRLDVECDESLVLRVSDSGVGMTPEAQERVFDRFWQVVDGESPKKRGMGLGLWVTRNLVRGLGGTIRLESTPGEGSTFEVELPLTPAS